MIIDPHLIPNLLANKVGTPQGRKIEDTHMQIRRRRRRNNQNIRIILQY